MALWEDDNTGNGQYTPIVKFDARSGRMKRLDRGTDGTEEIDITRSFKAVADMENIDVGWAKFTAGQAPSWSMVRWEDGVKFPARPDDDHKRAFRIKMKLAKECGGDVRELGGSAKALLEGFNQLHDAYLAEADAIKSGKLPVIILADTRAVVTETPKGKNTNYAPVFEIVGWVSRPADLAAAEPPKEEAKTRAAAPSTGSSKAAPPASVDEDDFG